MSRTGLCIALGLACPPVALVLARMVALAANLERSSVDAVTAAAALLGTVAGLVLIGFVAGRESGR